jgi:hypothetical protein
MVRRRYHAVLRKRGFPGSVRIAPNWRRFVHAFCLCNLPIELLGPFRGLCLCPAKSRFPTAETGVGRDRFEYCVNGREAEHRQSEKAFRRMKLDVGEFFFLQAGVTFADKVFARFKLGNFNIRILPWLIQQPLKSRIDLQIP